MKKEILKATFIYSVLTFLIPLSNLILMPLKVDYLSVEEYGVYSLSVNLINFFYIIGGVGIINAVGTYYYNYNSNKERLKKFISNLLKFMFLINIIIILSVLVIGPSIFPFFLKSNKILFFPIGILTLTIGLISNMNNVYLSYQRNNKNLKMFSIISLLIFSGSVISQLLIIFYTNLKVEGLLYANLISVLFGCIFTLPYIIKKPFKIIWKYIIPSFRFSIPILFVSIVVWVFQYADRFIIERYFDLNTLGEYGLLITISSLPQLVCIAIGGGIQPYLFESYQTNNDEKINSLYIFFIYVVLLSSSVLIFLA